ncbi:MAG TPA: DUF2914 domain-containing protein [Nitrospiria bacterium]|jgi:hypothetical protein|nr:DUF2914 domain-containing protein [Nitrospiria bacterium]
MASTRLKKEKLLSHGLLALGILTAILATRLAYSEEKSPPALTIEEAVIAPGVENLTPVKPALSFDSTVGKLYCFTRIKSDRPPAFIKHLWFQGDKMVMEVTLPVKSTSWRTYSTKTILPSASGDWKVDVTSEDGTVLKTLNFRIR